MSGAQELKKKSLRFDFNKNKIIKNNFKQKFLQIGLLTPVMGANSQKYSNQESKNYKKKNATILNPSSKKQFESRIQILPSKKALWFKLFQDFFFFKPRIQVKKIEWRVFVPKKAPSSGRTKIIDEKAADFFGGKKNMKVNLKRLVIWS